MSHLSDEQVAALTANVQKRVEEFGRIAIHFPDVTEGIVRLFVEAYEDWRQDDENDPFWDGHEAGYHSGIDEVMEALDKRLEQLSAGPTEEHQGHVRGHEMGYALGYADAKREMSPVRDEAEDKRLGIVGDIHINGAPKMSDDQSWAMGQVADAAYGQLAEHAEPVPDDGGPYGAFTPGVPRRPRTLAEMDAERDAQEEAAAHRQAAGGRLLDDEDTDEDGQDLEYKATRHDLDSRTLSAEFKADQMRAVLLELNVMAVNGVMPSKHVWDEKKPPELPTAAAIVARYDLTWGILAAYAKLIFEGKRKPKTPNKPTAKHPWRTYEVAPEVIDHPEGESDA